MSESQKSWTYSNTSDYVFDAHVCYKGCEIFVIPDNSVRRASDLATVLCKILNEKLPDLDELDKEKAKTEVQKQMDECKRMTVALSNSMSNLRGQVFEIAWGCYKIRYFQGDNGGWGGRMSMGKFEFGRGNPCEVHHGTSIFEYAENPETEPEIVRAALEFNAGCEVNVNVITFPVEYLWTKNWKELEKPIRR